MRKGVVMAKPRWVRVETEGRSVREAVENEWVEAGGLWMENDGGGQ
jgi:hypothetical protein